MPKLFMNNAKYVFKHIVRTVGVSGYVGSRDRCRICLISCIVKLMILWSLFQRYFANLTCTLTWRLWRFVGQVNDASALLLKCMFWISIHQIRAEKKTFYSMTCRSCNKNTQNAFIVDGYGKCINCKQIGISKKDILVVK